MGRSLILEYKRFYLYNHFYDDYIFQETSFMDILFPPRYLSMVFYFTLRSG